MFITISGTKQLSQGLATTVVSDNVLSCTSDLFVAMSGYMHREVQTHGSLPTAGLPEELC